MGKWLSIGDTFSSQPKEEEKVQISKNRSPHKLFADMTHYTISNPTIFPNANRICYLQSL